MMLKPMLTTTMLADCETGSKKIHLYIDFQYTILEYKLPNLDFLGGLFVENRIKPFFRDLFYKYRQTSPKEQEFQSI